ncbi:RIP metalloprotease RseP [Aestuariibius sp. HNIBRBA575]|uniref:RIP metalloprotease RseP n=1 Tax=Aestuariibius sp. HNIBRBA575 TaxID=3233343 RepID=UPI0034A1307F
MTALLPQFGSLGITIIAFIVALSIIVAIHEYGHYIVGRWSGIYAEVFSLGFGPVLFSRTDKRGTVWQIAAIPFGGYVKFLGDANAASVGGEAGGRNTMMGAPIWARSATVLAGPMFNFILSAIIFTGLAMTVGGVRDPLTVKDIQPLPQFYENGLQSGDEILAVNGETLVELADFSTALDNAGTDLSLDFTIRRDGTEMQIVAPNPMLPYVIGTSPNSAAEEAGIQDGDVVLSVNDVPMATFQQLISAIQAEQGRSVALEIWRDGDVMTFDLTPKIGGASDSDGYLEERYLVGISITNYLDWQTESLPFFEAAIGSVARVWDVITQSLQGLWLMITGKISSCNLSGPVGIAQVSGEMARAGLLEFISLIAVLSTAIGMLNLFPVPVLDGGHLVFHAYEAVSGRPPNENVLRIMMMMGVMLVLSLMIFGTLNDLLFC